MNTRRQEGSGGAVRLRAGDHAPAFTLTGSDGQTFSLAAKLRDGPVVLTFLDGMHSGAAAQLVTLSGCAMQIGSQGAALLAISPHAYPTSHELRVLHDVGRFVARHYGISGSATFVIDQASTIVLSLIDAAPGSDLTCTSVIGALSALRRVGGRRP